MTLATPMSIDTGDTGNTSKHASGGRLVTTDGRDLPLERAHLSARAGGGVARVTLEQRFRNPHDQPLVVTYHLPLPADGAVSGFSFRMGETRVVGEVDRRASARERFENALVEGKTAALLDQERSSLFTQRVGNIPPGAEIACEVVIDQRLVWLPEGAWEWRFPTVVGPRYMGAKGRVEDADAVAVDVSAEPLDTGMTLALEIHDTLARDRQPESPSHALRVTDRVDTIDVCFAHDARARLDRDVAVRWPVATPEVGLSVDIARPSGDAHQDCAYGLLTIVPPRPDSAPQPLPRDLIFLIDTSGSMGGRPLDQARRLMYAMIDTLSDRDRIELIEFGSRPRRWRDEPVAATRDGRRQACKWVRGLHSSGATEMHQAVLEALQPLRRGCQRQVVLITDGYIGFESEIVAAILEHLPESCRLHTVGVGSAPNRALTRAAARAGAGVELIIGLDEDAERVARRLVERTTAPLVTDVQIHGAAVLGTAPARLPDLFAESPLLVSLKLSPTGGPVRVHGTMAHGVFEQTIETGSLVLGEGNQAIAALYGRERVEDLEARCAVRGHTRQLDAEIERVGLDFQISTRLTSWVAVTDDATVDPQARRIEQSMPHEVPHGTQIESFGLRASARSVPAQAAHRPRASLAVAMPRVPPSVRSMSIGIAAPPPRPTPPAAAKPRSSRPQRPERMKESAHEVPVHEDASPVEDLEDMSVIDKARTDSFSKAELSERAVPVAKPEPARSERPAAEPEPAKSERPTAESEPAAGAEPVPEPVVEPVTEQPRLVSEQPMPATHADMPAQPEKHAPRWPMMLALLILVAAIALGLWLWLGGSGR